MRVILLGVAGLGILALALPAVAGSAAFVWNVTASAPAGIYRIDRVPWRAGDRVAVHPSYVLAADLERRGVLPRGRLLIKRVAAAGGDMVCRHDETVWVNGGIAVQARSSDSAGHSLPSWRGCRRLDESEVFLLGDTASSYDGRYFGVTRASEIVGRADLVLAF